MIVNELYIREREYHRRCRVHQVLIHRENIRHETLAARNDNNNHIRQLRNYQHDAIIEYLECGQDHEHHVERD